MTIRIFFMLCCIAVVIISLFCVVIVRRRKERIAKTIEKILWLIIEAALASIVTTITDRYAVVSLAHCIHYACMIWICYLMVEYICEYTKPKSNLLWIDDAWKILLLVDSTSLLLNPIFKHMMEFELISGNNGTYWVGYPTIWYSVHLVICTVMVIEAVVRFIIAIFKSPNLYKPKYVGIFCVFIFIVIIDIAFYYTGNALDVPIVFTGAGVIILVYNSFYIVPAILRRNMLSMIFHEMDDTIVLFDDKGNCVYLNNKMPTNTSVMDMKQADFDVAIKSARDKQNALCVNYGDESRYYEDRFDELRDAKGRYIGCYYIFRDITIERELLHGQHYLANFDSLTGLYNRERFFRYSERFMRMNPGEQFLMVCSDIRKLKVVNEVFGLEIGDRLLQLMAEALTEYTAERGVYGRVDADTFALCIPEKYFDVDDFTHKTNEAIKTLNINYPIINHIGIYRVEDRSLSASAMCDRAMLAVNSIKSDFMREIVYYDDTLREKLLQDQEILKDLKIAFDEDQFVIYLQPQINHKTGQIIGAEALVRWVHPTKGIIAPNEFIPLLETNGLITRLNMHVWELACKQLQIWKREGKENMSVSVNISNKDFFYVDIYEVLTGLIKKYDVSVESLKLEITERAFTINLAKQLEMIEKLQNEGFIIEMDDFGSGYSSLNSLKDIPVDVLKMDMAFMSKSDRYKRSADILQMVVAMADKLNMPVIAEGVETKEQADFLGRIGCNIIQGYYYAKPMPVHEFEEMLLKNNMQ